MRRRDHAKPGKTGVEVPAGTPKSKVPDAAVGFESLSFRAQAPFRDGLLPGCMGMRWLGRMGMFWAGDAGLR